jgi:hypothetical protein
MLVHPCQSACGVMCGALGRWSTADMKVMRARANEPGEVKGE